MTTPYDMSATEIVAGIRAREISATEVTQGVLDRIARLEPKVEAWATLDAEGSLAQAAERDRAGSSGPLHGVPIGIKDIMDVAGLPTGAGFAPLKDAVAGQDAGVVARLRAAGAIILGKTHTTQFANGDPAPTRNPWDSERTPGGSSAGSAAALAARMGPLALGTQTAGSVLRPATYCGVVGFKPTYNWVGRDGVLPLAWSLDHVGLFARRVDDVALLHGAILGDLEPATTAAAPRIALLTDTIERAQPDVGAHVSSVAERLRAAGAEVIELTLPVPLDLLLAVHLTIMESEVAAVHGAALTADPEPYGPFLRRMIEAGQLIPAAYLLQAQRLRRQIGATMDTMLAGIDAVLLPTAENVAPDRRTTGNRSFQAPWSLLGTPALTLPTGLSPEGLPIGSQLVARRGRDRALLALAAWCECHLGTIQPPEIV